MANRPLGEENSKTATKQIKLNQMDTAPKITVMEIFPTIEVDYSDSPDKMVSAGGYGWIDKNVGFPPFQVLGTGKVVFKPIIFGFDIPIRSVQSITLMKEKNVIPGGIEHMLSFGAHFPKEQMENPVVALGSVARVANYGGVAFLDRSGKERIVRFGWFRAISWFPRYRFLGIRIIH